MSRCSVTDIFSEIVKISLKVEGNKLSDKTSIHCSDLENKFRPFLRILYESVALEKIKKFDISNMCRHHQEAYETFKEKLAKISSDISYENFSKWINIKKIGDFYKITEEELAGQRLQIEFYKECKKIMWEFLMATNNIKSIECITKNSLNTDKIYEHMKLELEVYENRSISSNVATKINALKKKHSEELEKLQRLQKARDKERDESDGESVQIVKLYYLEKQILKSISEEEEDHDYYNGYFERHSKKLRNSIRGQGERKEVVRREIVKWLIVEEGIEMNRYLDPYEQDLVVRCRREYVRKSNELLEELIKEQSQEIKKENINVI